MSQRGSFVTEYIYCDKCFEAAKKVLIADDKYLAATTISPWTGSSDKELPIIAGKIGGIYSGEEFVIFEKELLLELSKVICHPLRIAVLAEDGEKIYTVSSQSGRVALDESQGIFKISQS